MQKKNNKLNKLKKTNLIYLWELIKVDKLVFINKLNMLKTHNLIFINSNRHLKCINKQYVTYREMYFFKL